jgi:hypothetical protein
MTRTLRMRITSERMPGRRLSAVVVAASLLVFMALGVSRLLRPHVEGVSASARMAMSHAWPSALRHSPIVPERGTTARVNEFMAVSGAPSFTAPGTLSSSAGHISRVVLAGAVLRRGYDAAAPPPLLKT